MEYVLNQPIKACSFSDNSLEELMKQLSSYEPKIKVNELKDNSELAYSYINGAKFIMENLLELYNKTRNSLFGGAKILALNMAINKEVLKAFLKEIKQELGIEKIFQGGTLDIPAAKQAIDALANKYNCNKINNEAFMLGVKKVAKVIDNVYHTSSAKPFQQYIINESEGIVKTISERLNELF